MSTIGYSRPRITAIAKTKAPPAWPVELYVFQDQSEPIVVQPAYFTVRVANSDVTEPLAFVTTQRY